MFQPLFLHISCYRAPLLPNSNDRKYVINRVRSF